MGFMDNLKNLINPADDDEEYFDDEEELTEEDFDSYSEKAPSAKQDQPKTASRPSGIGSGAFGSSLELKVVKPEKYDSATAEKIANHLLNKRSVVLNLEMTNKESARRLIDFLSGVAFSIGGYIQRVATNTFIIVPENVDVSGEQLQEAKKETEDLF